MKTRLIVLTIAAWLAASLVASAASAQSDRRENWQHYSQVEALREGVAWQRAQAWRWQGFAGIPRSPSAFTERKTAKEPFLRWLVNLWSARRARAYAYVRANPALMVRDWRTAVLYVQRWFPGTSPWLLDCSSSEGGHGRWVPNRKHSGAGGWMQYMEGTFYGDFDSAVNWLRARGVRVPSAARNWYSPLGQAIAAGWARHTGHTPPGKWTGALC